MKEQLEYTQQERDNISQLIDALPGLFYGRDDNTAWEDCVTALCKAVQAKRTAGKRQTFITDNRQSKPL